MIVKNAIIYKYNPFVTQDIDNFLIPSLVSKLEENDHMRIICLTPSTNISDQILNKVKNKLSDQLITLRYNSLTLMNGNCLQTYAHSKLDWIYGIEYSYCFVVGNKHNMNIVKKYFPYVKEIFEVRDI